METPLYNLPIIDCSRTVFLFLGCFRERNTNELTNLATGGFYSLLGFKDSTENAKSGWWSLPWPIDFETQSRDLKSTRIPQQKLLDFLKENHPEFKKEKDVLGVKLLEMSSKVEMIPGWIGITKIVFHLDWTETHSAFLCGFTQLTA